MLNFGKLALAVSGVITPTTLTASWRLRPHHLGFATMCFYLMFLGFRKGHAGGVNVG